ncbi:hypothetical protein Mal65_11460 [Crateriforma conspicua]|nr:hypothetical protein Mal65_11460 [Crateriforma conspicua]
MLHRTKRLLGIIAFRFKRTLSTRSRGNSGSTIALNLSTAESRYLRQMARRFELHSSETNSFLDRRGIVG